MWSQTFRQSLLLLPYKFILDTFEDWTICMENIQRTFDKVYDYNMKDSDIEIEALQSYGGSTSLKSKIIYDEVNSTLIIITCKI
ncbi:orotidine 5'-phosphate decarboxylase [Trifolium repens]|nr:orotidine 5'-phosphate decarboxylase [Trifolium repens]KAK2393712.1 orotidine 5'-phosphate decarboxylase [Trifolium repens]